MATIIPINDPLRATEAGAWCVENIGYKHWKMDAVNLMTPGVRYDFCFQQKKHAVEFALRWA
jgi:hypothetical protein